MTEHFQDRARKVLAPPVLETLTAAARAVAESEEDGAAAGGSLHAVGGVVRDVLLGRATEDLDLVLVGPAEILVQRIATALGAAVASESPFGTWRLALPGGLRLDLAAARSETYARPGALPSVAEGTLEEDLARRDFTLNALAVRLGQRWGEPLDPHGGIGDLEEGLLRVLHPGSFTDDPTRILRGLELSQRLGFAFAPETAALAVRALARTRPPGGCLATLSPARLRTAWRRAWGRIIGRGETALLEGLERAGEIGLLAALGRELDPSLRRLAGRLADAPVDPADAARLLFRALAGDDAGRARALAARWSSRPQTADAWAGFCHRLRDLRGAADEFEFPSAVDRALGAFEADDLRLLELLADGPLEDLVADYRERIAPLRLTITGQDLVAAGWNEGPAIGAALASTRAARLDGVISPEEELEYACRVARKACE